MKEEKGRKRRERVYIQDARYNTIETDYMDRYLEVNDMILHTDQKPPLTSHAKPNVSQNTFF